MSENEMNVIKQLIEAKKEKEIILSKLEECETTIRESEDLYLFKMGEKVINEELLQNMYWTSKVTFEDRVVLVGDFGESKELKELIKLVEPETDWMVSHIPLIQKSNISLGLMVFKNAPIRVSIQTPLGHDVNIDMMEVLDMLRDAHIDFSRIDLGVLDDEIEHAENRVSILKSWHNMLNN